MNPVFSYEYNYPLLIGIILLCIFFYQIKRNKKIKGSFNFSITIFDITLLLFSLYIGIDLYKTYGTFKIQNFYTLFIAIYIYIVFKILLSYKDKDKVLHIVSFVFLTLTIIEVSIGSFQFLGIINNKSTFFKVTGSFNSPANYSNYICSVIGIALYPPLEKVVKRKRNCYSFLRISIIIILGVAIFVFTQSRTAWITFILILFIFLFIERRRNTKVFNLKYKHILSVIILFLICFFCWSLTIKESSTQGRIFIIKRELSILKDNMVNGIGFGNFSNYYNKYQSNFFKNNPKAKSQKFASYINVGYNEYLQISLEGGILAILFLMILLFRVIIKIKRINSFSAEEKGFFLSFIAILILGLSSFPFRATPTLINFVIFSAVFSTLDTPIVNANKYVKTKYLFVASSVVFIFILIRVYKTYDALILWQQMINYSKENTLDQKKIKYIYNSTYTELCNNEAYLQSYADFLFSNGEIKKSTRLLKLATKYSGYYLIYVAIGRNYLKLDKNRKAEKNFLLAANMVPNRFVPKEWLMLFYYLTGDHIKTVFWINNILSYPIKIPSKRIDSIKHEAININKKINYPSIIKKKYQ